MDKDEEVTDPNYNPEEEVIGTDFKIIDLPEVKIETGEDNEEVVFGAKSKLYRWDKGEWKERGIGELKIIRNKISGVHRCFQRQEQNMKLRCMFEIVGSPGCHLEKLKTAEKSWFWTCIDFSDGAPKVEKFCARFKTPEDFEKFAQEFAKAHEINTKIAADKLAKKDQPKAEEKKDAKAEVPHPPTSTKCTTEGADESKECKEGEKKECKEEPKKE